VLQYAGDSLLAVFGADESHEDDAERAVRAGLALLAEAQRQGNWSSSSTATKVSTCASECTRVA
jgi:class 3 adenylate cyclase